MKKSFWVLITIVFGALSVSAGEVAAKSPWWLLTTRDPHVVRELLPRIHQYREEGRVVIVQIQGGIETLPLHLRTHLRAIRPDEVRIYQPARISMPRDARLSAMVNEVSRVRTQSDVQAMVSVKNRGAGSADSQRVTEWVRDSLAKIGLSAQLECFKPGICNVLAEQPGIGQAEESVYVVAHLDSVGHAFAGADDNASGTAALIEMARILSAKKMNRTIHYFVTNAEENGLVGSRAHVRALTPEQLKKIKFAVVMDMVAYNSNGVVDIETNREFEAQARWLSQLATTYTRLTPNITMPAWGSDHVPFLDKNVPAILTIEHWKTKTPCYHQACDVISSLNFDYMNEIIKLNVAAVAQVAEVLH